VLSIGVIGGYFTGQSYQLHRDISSAVQKGSEVANHGDGFVDTLSAKESIRNGEVQEFAPYSSFVPSDHEWDDETLEALHELKYTVISGSTKASSPMSTDPFLSPMQLPQSSETGILVKSWIATFADVVTMCQPQIDTWSVCVVAINPEEFAGGVTNTKTKSEALEGLDYLIDQIVAKQWVITTLRDFAKRRTGGTNATAAESFSSSSAGGNQNDLALVFLFSLVLVVPLLVGGLYQVHSSWNNGNEGEGGAAAAAAAAVVGTTTEIQNNKKKKKKKKTQRTPEVSTEGPV